MRSTGERPRTRRGDRLKPKSCQLRTSADIPGGRPRRPPSPVSHLGDH
ncbi:hypothetical protein KPATCC21470_7165 [Kitasatospora purpeofusca]